MTSFKSDSYPTSTYHFETKDFIKDSEVSIYNDDIIFNTKYHKDIMPESKKAFCSKYSPCMVNMELDFSQIRIQRLFTKINKMK